MNVSLAVMTRFRALLVVLFAVALSLAVVWLLWPRLGITPENAERIQNGMTRADVEKLLGGPARNESGLPDNFINDAFVNAEPDEIKRGRLNPGAKPFDDRRWASPGFVVLVAFDDSGRVIRHSHMSFDVDRSFLDRLRRWLHL
jgi:hypothetical protein